MPKGYSFSQDELRKEKNELTNYTRMAPQQPGSFGAGRVRMTAVSLPEAWGCYHGLDELVIYPAGHHDTNVTEEITGLLVGNSGVYTTNVVGLKN